MTVPPDGSFLLTFMMCYSQSFKSDGDSRMVRIR